MKNIRKVLVLSLIFVFAFTFTAFTEMKEIIGISKIVAHPALDAVEQGIMDELAELGYTDLEYDLQNANGEPSVAKQIAEKFKNENVTVAVGIATPTAQALVGTLTDIPVVFSAVTDPVGAGLVKSDTKGTANVTGVSDMTPVAEQIKMLAKIKKIKKLGNIYCSSEANSITIAKLAKNACKELKIKYVESTVNNSAEVRQATESIIKRVDAIYISTDNTVVSALSSVIDLALKYKKPIMSADPSSAKELQVFAAYGFNYYAMGRVTGKVIADILSGKKTIDMPTKYMTDPEALDLLLNLDVANKIGVKIPQSIMDQATVIVENGEVKNK